MRSKYIFTFCFKVIKLRFGIELSWKDNEVILKIISDIDTAILILKKILTLHMTEF